MKKMLLLFFPLLFLSGCGLKVNNDINTTSSVKESNVVADKMSSENKAELKDSELPKKVVLTGYVTQKHVEDVCAEGDLCFAPYDYIYFRITSSTDQNFLNEIKNDLDAGLIGMGCVKDNSVVYTNYSNKDAVEKTIIGDEYKRIIESRSGKLVKIEMEIPKPPAGGDATTPCYTNYRNFKVIN